MPVRVEIGAGAYRAKDRGLEPAEGKVVPVTDHGSGEVKTARRALHGELFDRRPGRIVETEQCAHLVVRLPGRIVERLSQQAIAAPVLHVEQEGMSAAHQKRDEGRREVGRFQRRCEEMAFEVMDPDHWLAQPVREPLAVHETHQERPDQARPGGDRDAIQLGEPDTGLGQGALDHRPDGAKMLPAGELGNDPAEHSVDILRENDQTTEGGAIAFDAENGSRGFVAAGFQSEDVTSRHRGVRPRSVDWRASSRGAPRSPSSR